MVSDLQHERALRSGPGSLDPGGRRRSGNDGRGRRRLRRVTSSMFAVIWLAFAIAPIYYMLTTSLRDQTNQFAGNPWSLPTRPTFANYRLVLHSDIVRYLLNSVVVTGASVLLIVAASILAAYTIVQRRSRLTSGFFRLMLFGLAIPVQGSLIPIFLIVTKLKIYDSLSALILPSVAFGLPISVLIMVNFMRDVPLELFDAMRVDGASNAKILFLLVIPMSRPAIMTIAFYNALQVWNNFLFPLILTQSPNRQTLPLALYTFEGQYSINIPALMAAVIISALPIVLIYAVGQRHLASGLAAGIGK